MLASASMKAVVLHAADDMKVEAWPRPEPGSGEVLLKVEVASICGTDVKVLHRTLMGQPAGPFVMGHGYAGTVVGLGAGVDEFRVGDRVAVEVHKGCDRCDNCIKGWYTSCLNYGDLSKGHRAKGLTCDGGFAEYAVNHINTLYPLPENLSFEQACMVTTAASPLWAIDLMGGYVAGETMLVQGPGPIGLIAVQLCKALGAARVILSGTRDSRLTIGKRLGADFTINVRKENLTESVRRRELERQVRAEQSRSAKHVKRSAGRAWCGGFALAISCEVHDGRGTERRRCNRTWAAWGSCVRPRGQLRRKGGNRQEPAKMAAPLRFPRHLHRAGASGREGSSGQNRPPRWHHGQQ